MNTKEAAALRLRIIEEKSEIKLLSKTIQNTKKILDELKTREEDWPKKGDWYWTYNAMTGEIHRFNWINSSTDNKYKANYMIFRAEEEAALSRDRGLVYRMLWELADGGIYILQKKGSAYTAIDYEHGYGMPRFSTKEKAMEAINIIGAGLLGTIFP